MKFFRIFKNAKRNLTTIGNKEPLNFLSILFLIALDIFVVFNLFQGLDRQTRQLAAPYDKVPYECINLARSLDVDNNDIRINIIENRIRRNENSYYSNQNFKLASYNHINDVRNENIIPVCHKVYDQAIVLSQDENLKRIFERRRRINSDISRENSIINRRKGNYDTMLLERIAEQKQNDSIIEGTATTVKTEIEIAQEKINSLEQQKKSLDKQILNNRNSQKMFTVIKSNSKEIKETLKSEEFWYPLKKNGVQFLFLFPLILFFWFLYKYFTRKEKGIISLIFSHLLVVSIIPVVWMVFDLIFSILPFHFFRDFFLFLESLHIVALFHYVLIGIGILVALILIYFVQRKLFSRKKTALKRISKKQCTVCGTRLNQPENYCYKCGEQVYVKCIVCGQETHKEGEYCEYCGIREFKENIEE